MREVHAEYCHEDSHVYVALLDGEPYPSHINVEGDAEPDVRRRVYAPTRTAERVVVSDGVTGHCACSGCRKAIDPWDAYCRHCGAKLEGGW